MIYGVLIFICLMDSVIIEDIGNVIFFWKLVFGINMLMYNIYKLLFENFILICYCKI